MRSVQWGVALACIAFGVTACGGSGSDDSGGGATAGGEAFSAAPASPTSSTSNGVPQKLNQCTTTTIGAVNCDEFQCEVDFANSEEGTIMALRDDKDAYDNMSITSEGDPITVCLREIPSGCAPGDTQGRMYEVTDKKASGGAHWTAPNSPHQCGGA